jgi:hypothetical protein
MRTPQAVLNSGNMNHLGNAARDAQLGTLLTTLPKVYAGAVSTVTDQIALPDNAKALCILRCFVTAGGAPGFFAAVTGTPAATQCGISPTGDIAFNAADNVTAAEVVYLTQEGEVFEETITVAANVGTFLGTRSSALILSCTATVGGSTGAKTVVARNTVPGAGNCALSPNGLGVTFAAADAVTQCTVRYVSFPNASAASALKTATLGY